MGARDIRHEYMLVIDNYSGVSPPRVASHSYDIYIEPILMEELDYNQCHSETIKLVMN